ncbi:class II aldolase/adducin family protein [Pseudonocardia benzenivorans]
MIHAHPPAVVAADLAGIAIRPIIGAFDIPGTRLAAGGIPVYPRGVLVRDRRLAAEMVDAMGDHPVVLLRAHGLTAVGDSPLKPYSGRSAWTPSPVCRSRSPVRAGRWSTSRTRTWPSCPIWAAASTRRQHGDTRSPASTKPRQSVRGR